MVLLDGNGVIGHEQVADLLWDVEDTVVSRRHAPRFQALSGIL